MVGGNWLKSIFFLFLDHLPGFLNYTFLNFQKKFFSLHPTQERLNAATLCHIHKDVLDQIDLLQIGKRIFIKNTCPKKLFWSLLKNLICQYFVVTTNDFGSPFIDYFKKDH